MPNLVSQSTLRATVGFLFAALHPDVLVSSTSGANSLTVAGTASSEYALTVMTVVAAVCFPLVLLYQSYTYVVFRHRITGTATQVDATQVDATQVGATQAGTTDERPPPSS
ncbi:bd-type cytochrome oxidase subunit II [Agromyces ramosus]|uniref:Bd-type cytochrome oxidase subunit II n=1 Tax=Agromyces ramosus TaxID=33879 RepID=A0A4Q7MCM1_9MICO|nr:cytochrome d ubiquinol oxidase subunit II [Agromyces ramosus]RZS65965.1 bd-type cytochrome oxidase subunit II [Agromyces ramosus]